MRPNRQRAACTPRRLPGVPTTWILTASVENHEATTARGFSIIGIKERNHRRAMEIEPATCWCSTSPR